MNRAPGTRGMNGNTDLTPDQRRALRDSLAHIAAQTREYLPDEYVVGAEIGSGREGARATVAVQPPAGNPVSAGFTPDFGGDADVDVVPADERTEVARGLAASAALQVKQAFGQRSDDPVAR